METLRAVWIFLLCVVGLQVPVVLSKCTSCPGECKSEIVDLTFVVDGSGSICELQRVEQGCQNWIMILEFITGVIDYLDIRADADRVALVQFANQARVEFKLTDHTTKANLVAAIMSVTHMTGNTNTSSGLYTTRTEVFQPLAGDRPNVRNVAIVITDGLSTWDNERTLPEAQLGKDAGIIIYSIGVTNQIGMNEVRRMSSSPQTINLNYFLVPYFDRFQVRNFVEVVHNSFCKDYEVNNNLNLCPGTFSHTGCYVVIETRLNWLGAETECAQKATAIGRTGMGELVSVTSQSLSDEMDWLMRALWVQRPVSKSMTEVWLGGRRDSKLFGGKDFPVWTWSNSTVNSQLNPQGCFEDQPGNPDLTYVKDFGEGRLTPDNCTAHCASQGYAVAGLQNGKLCYCGNTYGRYGGSDRCDKPCSAITSSLVTCGGETANNIYLVGGTHGQWSYLQPNNYGQKSESCGVLDGRWSTWQLASDSCYKKKPYVCEFPADSTYCINNGAAGGYKRVLDRCIYVSRDLTDSGTKSWFDAHVACHALGGQLLTVPSQRLHEQLKAAMNDVGVAEQLYWIGLLGLRWSWTSGDPFIYNNWGPDEPNEETNNCIMMTYSTSSNTFTWADGECNTRLPSICRIDVTTPLSTGIYPTKTVQTTIFTDASTVSAATKTSTTTAFSSNGTDPDLGASTAAGGLGTVEIVALIILCGLVLVGIICGIIACCYYKKGEKTSMVVYPDKADYLTSNVLVPYNQYYEKDYSQEKKSPVIMEPAVLTKTEKVGGEDHVYMSYNGGGATYANVIDPGYATKQSKRSKAYTETVSGGFNQPQQGLDVTYSGLGTRRMMSRDTGNMTISLDGTRISID